MHKVKSSLIVAILAAATLLSGCATPLGQQYGTAGAIGGAIIGGVAGGGRGALIGGAAGALVGGAVGDQQTYQNGGQPLYAPAPGYYAPAPRCWIQHGVPVRDQYGYIVGYTDRRVCR